MRLLAGAAGRGLEGQATWDRSLQEGEKQARRFLEGWSLRWEEHVQRPGREGVAGVLTIVCLLPVPKLSRLHSERLLFAVLEF